MSRANDNFALLERAKKGDKTAEDELIQNNIGLVYSTLKHFQKSSYEYEDLYQAGCIGLLKAARSFDNEKGTVFSTYAVCVISGEIKRLIRDNTPIKMSRHLREVFMRSNRAKNKLTTILGREPTIGEISNETNDDREDILMSLEANCKILSFDEGLNDENEDFSLLELIGNDPTEKITENVCLYSALSKLQGIERQIITLRYFKNKTQQEIADILKISQVQVSRKEKKILGELKTQII